MERILTQYESISYQKKLFAVLLLAILSLYLGYEDEITPAQSDLENSLVAAQNVDNEITKLLEVNKTYVSIQAEHRIATEEMDTLKKILPEDPEIEGLLAGLSQAAKQAGVVIISFTPDKTKRSSTASSAPIVNDSQKKEASTDANQVLQEEAGVPLAYLTPIKISVSGTFPQIVSFFDRALSLNRIIRLGTFKIALASGEEQNFTSTRNLEATSEFIAYSQRKAVERDAVPLNDDPYGVKQRRDRARESEQKEFTQNRNVREPVAVLRGGFNAE